MFKRLNQILNLSIISSIIFLIVGLCFIFLPTSSLTIICYITAIMLILNGLIMLILDFKDKDNTFFINTIIYEVLSIILGILIIINIEAFKTLLPICLGIWFIVSSILKLRLAFYTKDLNFTIFILLLLLTITSFICGIILLINPISSIKVIMLTVGLIITIYAIVDLTNTTLFKLKFKSIKEKIEEKL